MNYQHIYHAGNFADVLKHTILLETIKGLQQQKKSIFILDTHAGRGRYNLKSLESKRSGEHIDGISFLYNQHIQNSDLNLPDAIDNYIKTVRNFNKGSELVYYPGSPSFIQQTLRPHDRAAFCELNEKEFFKLHALMRHYKNIKLVHGDGYEALMSFMPPREKSGLVLIDPPFEQRDEIINLEKSIFHALKLWPQGTFMLWYPVKESEAFNAHFNILKTVKMPALLFELQMPSSISRSTVNSLRKTAVIVLNPPENLVKQQNNILKLSHTLFERVY